jgi:hypothetical protein
MHRVTQRKASEIAKWRAQADAELAELAAATAALQRQRAAHRKQLEALRDRWRLEQAERAAADQAAAEVRARESAARALEERQARAASCIQRWYRNWRERRKASKAGAGGGKKKKKGGKASKKGGKKKK